MSAATVHDISSGHFRRRGVRTDETPQTASAFDIADDFADALEVVHVFCSRAGYPEPAHTFVLALATAAHGDGEVVVYDWELADLQGCSERTVQRQRKAYKAAAKQSGVELVEFDEQKYDKLQGKYPPTKYRILIREPINEAVADARASKHWHETDRSKQRAALQLAAGMVFDDIPRGDSKARPAPRPRLATSEIETCLKVARTKVRRAKELASKLSPGARADLLSTDNPRRLRQQWEELRAEMDALFQEDATGTVENVEVKDQPDKLSGIPPVTANGPARESSRVAVSSSSTATPDPEAEAAWGRVFSGLRRPPVRAVTVRVRPPERTTFQHPDDFVVEPWEGGGP